MSVSTNAIVILLVLSDGCFYVTGVTVIVILELVPTAPVAVQQLCQYDGRMDEIESTFFRDVYRVNRVSVLLLQSTLAKIEIHEIESVKMVLGT